MLKLFQKIQVLLVGLTGPNAIAGVMLAGLAIIMIDAGPAHAERLACKDIWPRLAENIATRTLQCERVATIPQSGRKFPVYTVRGWTHPRMDELVRGIGRGIRDTVALMDPIHRVPPTAFFLSNLAAFDDDYGEAVDIEGERACAVAINAGQFGGRRRDLFDKVEFVTAHELIHCLQFVAWPRQMAGRANSSNWWVEGGAEYLANVVYPNVNMEHEWLDDFVASAKTKNLMGMKYEAWVFFQYLGNQGWSPERIFNLFGQMATEPGFEPEYKAVLAAIPDMPALFHDFAEAAVGQTIRDAGGGNISALLEEKQDFIMDEVPTAEMRVYPFTINYFNVYAHGNGTVRLAGREDGAPGMATAAPPGRPLRFAEPPREMYIDCNAVYAYAYVVTSAKNEDTPYRYVLEAEMPEGEGCGLSQQQRAELPVGSTCMTSSRRDRCLVGEWRVDPQSLGHWMEMALGQSGVEGAQGAGRGQAIMFFNPDGTGMTSYDNLTVAAQSMQTSTPGMTVNTYTQFNGGEVFHWSTRDGTLNRCPTEDDIMVAPVTMLNDMVLPAMDPFPLNDIRQGTTEHPPWSGIYRCTARSLTFEFKGDAAGQAYEVRLTKVQ